MRRDLRASESSTSAGSDADAPAAQESFVLRRLQARLQELETENDELRAGAAALEAQCETNDELLGTLQASLDETSAEAEEAEARVRALERQLEDPSKGSASSPLASSLFESSRRTRSGTLTAEAPAVGLPSSLYVVLLPVVVYHLAVAYQNWLRLNAAPLQAPTRPLPLVRLLWTLAALAGLMYAWLTGCRAAVRATCVAPLLYHGAVGSAALCLGVDADGLVPDLAASASSAGRVQIALAFLLVLACWVASEPDPEPRRRKAD